MPKLHGTSLLGILTASVGFYFIGFLWYGFMFMEKWMKLQGLPMDGDMQIMPMVWGFIITILQVIGINYVLKQSGATTLSTCAKIAAILGLYLAVPFAAYASIYAKAPLELFMIDASHLFTGFLVAGITLSLFRGKDSIVSND